MIFFYQLIIGHFFVFVEILYTLNNIILLEKNSYKGKMLVHLEDWTSLTVRAIHSMQKITLTSPSQRNLQP
jgi:hypothetical protein